MPRTRFHKQSTDEDVFSGFEPPATTDGSFQGTMKQRNATRDYLEKKFQEELTKCKERLKQACARVGLTVRGGSIQLQATLPLKPGDKDTKGTGRKQYNISLNIPANLNGLKTAEEEAYELGKLVARNSFTWNDKYLGRMSREKDVVKTMGDLLPLFESKYFETRKRTRKSEGTFSKYIKKVKQFVPLDTPIQKDALFDLIKNARSDSARFFLKRALKVLCKDFGIDIDFSTCIIPKVEPAERNVPSDADIVENYKKFEEHHLKRRRSIRKSNMDTWILYRWIYGMLAAYGVRPRELLLNPDIKWWMSEENIDQTWKVDREGKTGAREAFPVRPEWVKLFDLKNEKALELLQELLVGKVTHDHFENMVCNISLWFRRLKIPFHPYDLRHAWAIRAHLLGIPIKAAADNLGHSVDIHTKTYQKWFSLENRKVAIRQALTKKSEIEVLREENERLRAEVEMLRKLLSTRNLGFAVDER